jgi:hypothetical protein
MRIVNIDLKHTGPKKFCYSCYLKHIEKYGMPDRWSAIPIPDPTVKKKCTVCGTEGVFVRALPVWAFIFDMVDSINREVPTGGELVRIVAEFNEEMKS